MTLENMHVLILEDDRDLANQWAEYLSGFGYKCDVVHRLHDAEAMCQQTEYMAVIVDMFLRDDDGSLTADGGLTFITHLRMPSLAGTPAWGERVAIITVTGSDSIVEALSHAKVAGADRTFRKPVDNQQLLDALFEASMDSQ